MFLTLFNLIIFFFFFISGKLILISGGLSGCSVALFNVSVNAACSGWLMPLPTFSYFKRKQAQSVEVSDCCAVSSQDESRA